MSYSFPLAFGAFLGSALLAAGASAPIGTVTAGGDFRVAGASVRGNGTLFSGDLVESDNLRANVLVDGVKELTLAPHSRGKIFADRTILQLGAGELRGPSAYAIEAGTLRISTPSGRATVGYSPDSGQVTVAANEGRVDVQNARGVLIAQLQQGHTVAFQVQNNAASPIVEYTGVVRRTAGGRYLLTDKVTGMTVELQGNATELERSVGKTRVVRGAIIVNGNPVNEATAIVLITSISDPRSPAPAGTAAGVVLKAGLSKGAIAAIATGGAVGGVVGGLAAADKFGGDASR